MTSLSITKSKSFQNINSNHTSQIVNNSKIINKSILKSNGLDNSRRECSAMTQGKRDYFLLPQKFHWC